MIWRLARSGLRACSAWRLVLFDSVLTLLALSPLILTFWEFFGSTLEGLEPFLSSGDARLESLALAEAIDRAEPRYLIAGVVLSLLLVCLVRTFLGAALATSAGSRYAGVAAAGARGLLYFRYNLLLSVLEAIAFIVLALALTITLLSSFAALAQGLSGLLVGLMTGLVLGVLALILVSVRAIADLARVLPRVLPDVGAWMAIRMSLRWFARISFIAAGLAALWLVAVLLLETFTLLAEWHTGGRSPAGAVFILLLFMLTLLARSSLTVSRYASMGELCELLHEVDQEEEMSQWMTEIPEALWVLPPSSDEDLDQDDSDWPSWGSGSGERDH